MRGPWQAKLPFDVDFARHLRIPFGLRIFFRAAFALLTLATLALALSVLVEEKQLSLRNYQEGFRKSLTQIATQLRHPTGQLALLNPDAHGTPGQALHPLVLPYAAIDFDDRNKVQQAIEMSGCQVRYPDGATLCVAVGNNPWAGGFIYLAGSFISSDELVARAIGGELTQAHRAQVQVSLPGQQHRWVAPFETTGEMGSQSQSLAPAVRGRLTGFAEDANGQLGNRPVRDFRGWLWQDARCLGADSAPPCARRSFYSVRLPIDLWREAIFAAGSAGARAKPVWPPADLDQIAVQLRMLPPGSGAALFDSQSAHATRPFSLAELREQLQSGETLQITRLANGSQGAVALASLSAEGAASPAAPHWLSRLIAHLPVQGDSLASVAQEEVQTSLGRYQLTLRGDGRSVDTALGIVATRISWFVGAMLLAIALTWAAIELRIIRRITLLSRRAAAVSHTVRGTDEALALDLSDLRSRDELGVLASALADLLQRVNEDARRERIRAAQEKDQWHAVGHEIMSPLQSLKALHAAPGDPSARYIQRMQQAVRVLYGSASPSEAFEATTLHSASLDLNQFLQDVAANAPAAGIAQVQYQPLAQAVLVKADEHALEDAVTHVLRNAERYRVALSPIRLTLQTTETEATLHIGNQGPTIAPELLDKIFEYGVSDQADGAASGSRGQGLFVARTYLAKMGGTISVRNLPDGVSFALSLQRV